VDYFHLDLLLNQCILLNHSLKPDNNSRKRQNHDNQQQKTKQVNTSVYVTNLPSDVTVEELAEIFSKYGVLMEDFVNGMF